MTPGAPPVGQCCYCNAPAPRLYRLPPRALRGLLRDGPACHFCYIKLSGIKPTKSRLVSASELAEGQETRPRRTGTAPTNRRAV